MSGRTSTEIDVASCLLFGTRILALIDIQSMRWMCPCTLPTEITCTWMPPRTESPSGNFWMASFPSCKVRSPLALGDGDAKYSSKYFI